jgi:two-component system, OmpR family, phosphate regulon sensor histidine kinase PhoR
LLFLALPLAVAVWALGGYAGQRQRNNADQRLAGDLVSARDHYGRAMGVARDRAAAIAATPRVQRALRRGPRAARRLQRRYHHTLFVAGRKHPVVPPNAVGRTATVIGQGKSPGRVIVLVPLDPVLARRLARQAEIPDGRELGFLRGKHLILESGAAALQSPLTRRRQDVRVGGSMFRVVAVRVEKTDPTDLVVVEHVSKITAAADQARDRVLELGFGFMAALLVMAYALAPAIARSRVSRQQRDQAERVLAHVGDGVFVVDHDGIVRLWNPAAEAITELRAATVSDRPAREAIPGWEQIEALVPVASRPGDREAALNAGTVPIEVEGQEIWLSVVGAALEDGIVYAFRDVTRERRLEDLRAQFVATISHELRTPLAALHGAAITLREHGPDLNPATHDDLLDMIAVQSRRLADLVEEILVTGQLDAGSLSVVKESFEAEELVRETVAAAQLRLDKEARIDVSIPPLLPKATGDPDRTRQVLLNLLDNAIKYSPRGGRIEIAVAPDDGRLRFMVRDEGLGIPLGEQERVFDKFYRLDPDQRRGIGGSGLGLYISRELVRLMDGRIWAESEPGEGTVLTFELPLAERARAAV